MRSRFAATILRANDVQTIGTHNSYHIKPPVALAKEWRYTHRGLREQLELGVRSLVRFSTIKLRAPLNQASQTYYDCRLQELDVHYDPIARTFGVYHEPFVDCLSTCGCLTACMREVASWSASNPGHSMLKVVVEPKFNIDAFNPYQGAEGTAHMRALQNHLMAVWPADKVLTPAMVQGDAPTMRDAIRSCGWPSDHETRGHAMFILDAWTENADAGVALRALPEHERLFFIRGSDADAIQDDVAVVELSSCECRATMDADACATDTKRLVSDGYIVRAAMNVAACVARNTTALEVGMLHAGVQILATDFVQSTTLPCGPDRRACCRPNIQAPCTAESAAEDPLGVLQLPPAAVAAS